MARIRSFGRRVRYIAAVMFTLCVCMPASAAGQPNDNPPPQFTDPARRAKLAQAFPAIDQLMAQRFAELRLPGLVYGVVIDGELVKVRGLGFREIESTAAVDEHTVFRIASMTKSFTALAILKLRDAGRLSLDDPIGKHVPELASLAPPMRDAGPVTIRHLLTHSAGFPEDNPLADRQMVLSGAQFSELLRRGVPFSNAPGGGFEYSNLGFAILGRIVSRVSRQPYQAYVQREILDPLGMTDTYWDSASAPAQRLASGYGLEGDKHFKAGLADGGSSEFAAIGALMLSSHDLARWIAVMLSAYPPRDAPELPPALRRTLREMQHGWSGPSLFASRAMPGAPTSVIAFAEGYGLFVYTDCRFAHAVSHSGGLPGFGSNMRWLPEHGVGVFAMANLTYAPVSRMTNDILAILADTGALKPRTPMPSPALVGAASEAAKLIEAWEDERARRIAAPNLFLDTPLQQRRDDLRKAREGLGACRADPIKAENALRGSFHMVCDQGWIDVDLTLTPTRPPLVQHLSARSGRNPSATLKRALAESSDAIANGGQKLRLAATLDRNALGAVLEDARLRYGACRLGDMLDGDGVANARARLVCDRGDLILSIRLEGELVASLSVDRLESANCIP